MLKAAPHAGIEGRENGLLLSKDLPVKPQAGTQLRPGNHKKLYAGEAETGRSEFRATQVYRVSSRTTRPTQRNPVSKSNQIKTNKTQTNLTKKQKRKQSI